MIKRCPSCNRTYSDDSISFCLADGALLSAPYDAGREEPPPTQVLPTPTRAATPPTQPANVAVPTITSLPDFRRSAPPDDVAPRNAAINWIVFALAAMALIAGSVLFIHYAWPSTSESSSASRPGDLVAANSTPSLEASPSVSSAKMTASPGTTLASEKPPEKPPADPVLFPPNEKQMSTPAASPSADTSKVFSGREVEQQVRILSKPEPTYTGEARRNQITGTVVLRAVFSSSGEVTNIHAVSGLPDGLTERAIAAARQIKFVPATKDGRPVSIWMELQYNFNLY